jgi:ElaB/YqjD/DUF883 family membrane-anchored ribosome-binding protein
MDSELKVIRSEMEVTRSSLADKLEALESQVRGTVETATEAVATARETVESTVESVQETVEETVQTVRETFDVAGHVDRHPWAVFGAAVAVGFAAGALLPSGRRQPAPAAKPLTRLRPPSGNGAVHAQASRPLHEGLELLRGMAVGGLMGLVRDMVLRVVPPNFTAEARRWVDDLTISMGGKPIEMGTFRNNNAGGH